jgi:hypothetical protein
MFPSGSSQAPLVRSARQLAGSKRGLVLLVKNPGGQRMPSGAARGNRHGRPGTPDRALDEPGCSGIRSQAGPPCQQPRR